jgi:GT2 family glycosyltransferase
MSIDETGKSTIAAVVLNWRDTEQTISCVRSILHASEVCAIYVVDNESDGSLRQALEKEDSDLVEIIESPINLGFSAGVNLGLAAAIGKLYDSVLVINNDAVLIPGAVRHLQTALLEDSRVAIVGPQIVGLDGSLQAAGARLNRITMSINPAASDGPPDYLTWACVLVPRRTLEEVGLLDERFFMYWEDADYGFRIQDAGGIQRVVPEAGVVHNISSSHAAAGGKVLCYSALGLSVFASKRGGAIFAAAVVRLALRCVKQVLRGRFDTAGGMIRFWKLGRSSSEPAFQALRDFVQSDSLSPVRQ